MHRKGWREGREVVVVFMCSETKKQILTVRMEWIGCHQAQWSRFRICNRLCWQFAVCFSWARGFVHDRLQQLLCIRLHGAGGGLDHRSWCRCHIRRQTIQQCFRPLSAVGISRNRRTTLGIDAHCWLIQNMAFLHALRLHQIQMDDHAVTVQAVLIVIVQLFQ